MGIDDVFAVIAEGTRRQILERLRDGDRAVGELVVELQVSQPTVSKHLKVLREAGLVTMRAQGQKRYYALRAEPLDQVRSWLDGFEPRAGDAEPFVDELAPAADATLGAEQMTDADAPAAATIAATAPGATEPDAGEPAPDVLAAAVLAGTAVVSASDSRAVSLATPGSATVRPIGRTMGRAAERAVDLLSQLRRRRDTSS